MFFFRCTVSSFDDSRKVLYMFPAEQDKDENGIPVFPEKALTSNPEFKKFVKETKTFAVDIKYELYKTDTAVEGNLTDEQFKQIENTLEKIDGNEFPIEVGKSSVRRGKNIPVKYLYAAGGAALLIIIIIVSSIGSFSKSGSESVSDSSDSSENSTVSSDVESSNSDITESFVSEKPSVSTDNDDFSQSEIEDEPITETASYTDTNGYTTGGYNDGYNNTGTQKEYTITFNANGGEGSLDSISAAADEIVKLPDIAEASKKLTRKGCELIGFSDSKEISYPLSNYKMPYENTVLYAVWEPREYTVTYNSNGGIGQLSSVNVKFGKDVSLPTDIAVLKKDFILLGWHTDKSSKTALKSLKMPAENVTLYAVWSDKKPKFKVTFHFDENTMVREFEAGTVVNMRDAFDVEKNGYTLSGWYLENSEKPLENLKITSDCSVYGKWKKAEYITVAVYDGEFKTFKTALDMNGEANFITPKITDKKFGCTYGFSANKPNGEFNEIQYYPNQNYKFKKDVTLYKVVNEYGGSGTADDPYLIDNYEQLLYLSKRGGKGYFKQTKDLVFPNNTDRNPVNTMKISKGYEDKNADFFVYDGGCHVIKNLHGTGGLFGNISASTLKNIIIENAEITVKSGNGGVLCNEITTYDFDGTDGKKYASGNSKIINCTVSKSRISAENADNIGIICGSGGEIENCVSQENSITGGKSAGGIVGNAVKVKGCISRGNSAEAAVSGGIAGTAEGAEIYLTGSEFFTASGNITGCGVVNFAGSGEFCGGIVGRTTAIKNSYIRSCYAAGILLGGQNTGAISGGDGELKFPHKYSYCIADSTGDYPVTSGEKPLSKAVKLVLSVPKDNIKSDGVLSVLNAEKSGFSEWIIDPNQNGGYPVISSYNGGTQ